MHAEALLCRLTGAEAAVVVNNNAAATMIVLAALAAGREVIVSRGELVEIGGGFRVPDVMAQSGAVLREVGTTNKTRAADYAAAISERTALILRVHPSNFRIEGFTERPTLEELVALGKKFNIPVAEDLGSGYLALAPGRTPTSGRTRSDPGRRLRDEPAVADSVAAGVDVCCFSGDKLLGGPQAGIIVGRAALVDRIRTHPLMRALRVDKMTYAALEATLAEYAAGRAADDGAGAADADDDRRRDPRARARRWPPRSTAIAGWRAELVAGVVGDRRRQRAGRRAADVAGRDRERRPRRRCARERDCAADAADHRADRARPPAAGSADGRCARTISALAALSWVAIIRAMRHNPPHDATFSVGTRRADAALPPRSRRAGTPLGLADSTLAAGQAGLRRAVRLVPRRRRRREAPARVSAATLRHAADYDSLVAIVRNGIPALRCRRSPSRSPTKHGGRRPRTCDRSAARAARAVAGDAHAARALYESTGCASCHVVSGRGGVLGPELTRSARGAAHRTCAMR